MKMTDCRKCEYSDDCIDAKARINELNDYDMGIIKDDNGWQINPYKLYNGCDDYMPLHNSRVFSVVDNDWKVYCHDCDRATAEQVLASLSPELIEEKGIEIIFD